MFLNIRTTFFRFFEWGRVLLRYYRRLSFLFTDLLLSSHYIARTPHQVSKAFMIEQGAKNIYTYGETPLTTLDRIARQCGILSKDVVYELGCGSGRTVFWLHHFIRCKAVGIDYQPTFIRRANRVKEWLRLDRIAFYLEDMLSANYRDATVIYLYGTCLEDAIIEKLLERFEQLKSGTKVITVSYPLTDYSESYKLIKHFPARFPWGKAEVFLNLKK